MKVTSLPRYLATSLALASCQPETDAELLSAVAAQPTVHSALVEDGASGTEVASGCEEEDHPLPLVLSAPASLDLVASSTTKLQLTLENRGTAPGETALELQWLSAVDRGGAELPGPVLEPGEVRAFELDVSGLGLATAPLPASGELRIGARMRFSGGGATSSNSVVRLYFHPDAGELHVYDGLVRDTRYGGGVFDQWIVAHALAGPGGLRGSGATELVANVHSRKASDDASFVPPPPGDEGPGEEEVAP